MNTLVDVLGLPQHSQTWIEQGANYGYETWLKQITVLNEWRTIAAAKLLGIRSAGLLPDDYRSSLADFGGQVVGGAVRDAILGHHPDDWDYRIDPVNFARLSSSATKVFPRSQTMKLSWKSQTYDVASWRRDIYLRPGELASVQIASWNFDLVRRDFNWNALYCDPQSLAWFDPFDANQSQELRALHPLVYCEDPLRIVRALRLSSQTKLPIAKSDLLLIAKFSNWLELVAPHRIEAEFNRAARAGTIVALLQKLRESGWTRIPSINENEKTPLAARSFRRWLRAAQRTGGLTEMQLTQVFTWFDGQ